MDVDYHQTTLPNGMRIIAEVNGDAHTSAVGFFVRAGVRDEPVDRMGVSHFLEHMMFKGTERRTADDVNREFDEIGANYNASTGQEVTTYWAHVLPDYLPRAIDLWTDMLRPSLRNEDFEIEKKVILEEIGMYADRPFWIAYEQAMADRFGGHALGFQILGTPQTIKDLSADQMRDYFEQRYGPDQIVCAMAGRLDFDACVEQIASACAAWPATGAGRTTEPPPALTGRRVLQRPGLNMAYLLGLCAGPSEQDQDRYAASVLSHVLGDTEGSRLYWRLIDPGLADEAEVSHHGFDRTGLQMFYASCEPGRADDVEAMLLEELDRAADQIDPGEVQRAVSKMAMGLTLRSERPAGRMMSLGGQRLYDDTYRSLDQELDRIRAIDVDAVADYARRYPFRPHAIVRLEPQAS